MTSKSFAKSVTVRAIGPSEPLTEGQPAYTPERLTKPAVGRIRENFTTFLDKEGLRGKRIGILRESMGYDADPASEDFTKISEVFDKAVADLIAAGAEIVDPITIPELKADLAKRATNANDEEESFMLWLNRSKNPPYRSRREAMNKPDFQKVHKRSRDRWMKSPNVQAHYEYLKAREDLMTHVLQVMADNKLDAIVHKAVEHQPTLIKDGLNPPFVDQKGAPHINTFLVYVPSIVVPAGYTRDRLPAGITFLGRPYDDGNMIKFAYAYEQATRHRIPPASVTPL